MKKIHKLAVLTFLANSFQGIGHGFLQASGLLDVSFKDMAAEYNKKKGVAPAQQTPKKSKIPKDVN